MAIAGTKLPKKNIYRPDFHRRIGIKCYKKFKNTQISASLHLTENIKKKFPCSVQRRNAQPFARRVYVKNIGAEGNAVEPFPLFREKTAFKAAVNSGDGRFLSEFLFIYFRAERQYRRIGSELPCGIFAGIRDSSPEQRSHPCQALFEHFFLGRNAAADAERSRNPVG